MSDGTCPCGGKDGMTGRTPKFVFEGEEDDDDDDDDDVVVMEVEVERDKIPKKRVYPVNAITNNKS